jgi:Zn-dependent M28 family amino/carboxypeptidase
LILATEEYPEATETLLFDVPGRSDDRVVLSAHLDGHDLAESAIDNATGVAVALAVARAVAPHVAEFRRGLSLCLFSVEEWGLTGSRLYVHGLAPAERDRIALNVNLDSVGGSTQLTALTSDFPRLDAIVRQVAHQAGLPIGIHRPLMSNSDHANFAAAGIPALRLVAGFDDPASNLRYVLTPADTREKVSAAELAAAAQFATALVVAACRAPAETMRRLRERNSPKES